ncbi:hypothetical protein AALD74_21195 [Lachnospiraceae bacterium 48-21]
MKIFIRKEDYYCKVYETYSLERFRKELDKHLDMRKKSFADQYTKKIVMDFFRYAKDMKKEYLNFYAQEYDNFQNFLFQKELWSREETEKLNLNKNQTILLLRPFLCDYNAKNFVDYDDEGLQILNQMLEEINL